MTAIPPAAAIDLLRGRLPQLGEHAAPVQHPHHLGGALGGPNLASVVERGRKARCRRCIE